METREAAVVRKIWFHPSVAVGSLLGWQTAWTSPAADGHNRDEFSGVACSRARRPDGGVVRCCPRGAHIAALSISGAWATGTSWRLLSAGFSSPFGARSAAATSSSFGGSLRRMERAEEPDHSMASGMLLSSERIQHLLEQSARPELDGISGGINEANGDGS